MNLLPKHYIILYHIIDACVTGERNENEVSYAHFNKHYLYDKVTSVKEERDERIDV